MRSNNTVVAGSDKSTKYQYVLYAINFITGTLGAALVAVCIWCLTLAENVTLPNWILPFGIVLGAVVVVVSCCGCQGAKRSNYYNSTGSFNWPLALYLTILIISFIGQIILAVWLLQLYGVMDTALTGNSSDSSVADFDNDFVEWTQENPSKWEDTQNHFDCCGYQDTTDATATGDICTSSPDTATACRPKLLQKTKDQSLTIAILCIVFGFMELMAIIAATCLLCYHRRQRAVISNPKAYNHHQQPMTQVVTQA